MAKKYVPAYKTVDELMEGAVKSTLFEDVREQISAAGALDLSSSDAAEELEGWSMIGNKIIGQEDEPTL